MSSHAATARTVKVIKILDRVPAGETAAEVAAIAEWLAERTKAERDAIAAMVGVNPPSEETWRLVVEAQRARRPNSANPFARVRKEAV
ncbi:MAG: hypothetical protein EPN98_21645 [Phenylobacterium sp.]|uniref:hypothetical protein n=1 Tax=Phenylobacterium sp. TaxID=1871053 RepID=UPI0012205DAD|nr:hypothetical protein [Phenylobacterium sp.]TAL29049.1 MAG: hypothetical protein EPN98_21645 [Phenylobacterium sp.]